MVHDLIINTGPLESVTDLTVVSINSTTVLISWSPSFTLEGVPILGYNVIITDTASGENETMSVEGDTTMLYYSIDHPDPDNNFTVTVVPINGAGPGENETKVFLFSFSELNLCYSLAADHFFLHNIDLQACLVARFQCQYPLDQLQHKPLLLLLLFVSAGHVGIAESFLLGDVVMMIMLCFFS